MSVILTLLGFIFFIYSVIVHEISHGFIAEKLGDPTARLSGRLTLNPLPHIDPVTSLLLPLLLLTTGSPIIIGAAKPVPIDPFNLRNPRKEMGLIGLAGPASNLLLAIAFGLVARLISPATPSPEIFAFLARLSLINIVLAVFNLIPIPPLDGGRILAAILPKNAAQSLMGLERIGIFIVIFLLLFPNPIFSLQNIIFSITSTIFGIIFPSLPVI
jgi:Zn-dependent protease